jgi:hypothetical protein
MMSSRLQLRGSEKQPSPQGRRQAFIAYLESRQENMQTKASRWYVFHVLNAHSLFLTDYLSDLCCCGYGCTPDIHGRLSCQGERLVWARSTEYGQRSGVWHRQLVIVKGERPAKVVT